LEILFVRVHIFHSWKYSGRLRYFLKTSQSLNCVSTVDISLVLQKQFYSSSSLHKKKEKFSKKKWM
jgi:hypothetical protein